MFEKELTALRERLDKLNIAWERDTMTAEYAAREADGINDWLKDNREIVKLSELIPKAKMAEGELAYITKGQYRKHWKREPKPEILTKDGKRVRWEYALDELAGELRLPDGEAVRDMVVLAQEYKGRRDALLHSLVIAEDEIKAAEGKLMKVTVHIGKREMVADTQDDRSERAKAIDRAKQAKNVLTFPNVDKWLKEPGRYDIRSVDTVKVNRKPKRRSRPATPGIGRLR